jgi:hypothetical protein
MNRRSVIALKLLVMAAEDVTRRDDRPSGVIRRAAQLGAGYSPPYNPSELRAVLDGTVRDALGVDPS